MYCIEHSRPFLLFSLTIMAKRRVYKTTTIAGAKAAASKYRAGKKKVLSKTVSRKADRGKTQS
jgi:hypothetical protein